jgi:uncharacterized protein YjbI with pentapeptide repeats
MSTTRRRSERDRPRLPDLTRFDGSTLDPDGDYVAVDFVDLDLTGVDAPDALFLECRLQRCGLDGGSLRRARIAESHLLDLHATTVDFTDSTWRDTQMWGGRLGAMSAVGATWTGIRIVGSQLGFLGLAGAHLQDVVFDGCEIRSLDARESLLDSVTFVGCVVDELNVAGARLAKVDLAGAALRTLVGVESLGGATISSEQLADLAPVFATALGVEVRGDPPAA